MIQLKRFSMAGRKPIRLDAPGDCPLTGLDLSAHVVRKDAVRPPVYDLFAVVNHYGTTATLGHYSAFCQVGDGDSWRHFDDADVKPLKPHEVVSKDAYVLFYNKRTALATAAGKAAATKAQPGVPTGHADVAHLKPAHMHLQLPDEAAGSSPRTRAARRL